MANFFKVLADTVSATVKIGRQLVMFTCVINNCSQLRVERTRAIKDNSVQEPRNLKIPRKEVGKFKTGGGLEQIQLHSDVLPKLLVIEFVCVHPLEQQCGDAQGNVWQHKLGQTGQRLIRPVSARCKHKAVRRKRAIVYFHRQVTGGLSSDGS